jgi:hypothetical protein
MATLTEQLVHQVDSKHNKDDLLYIALQLDGFGKPVIRIWDDKSGEGVDSRITETGFSMWQKELVRTRSDKPRDILERDIYEGSHDLADKGYKVRVLIKDEN